jgi:ribosome-binding factor A
MPSKVRVERIAERIYEEVTELLLYEIQDPRIAGVTVTDVSVDRELSYADVYVSALEGRARAEEIMAGMQSAAGFIRGRLAKSLQLRSFPVLRIHWDPTPERADRIEQLLHQIREEQPETDEDESAADDNANAESDE